MKKKGRFSLVLSIILIAAGISLVTLGVLDQQNLLSIAFLKSFVDMVRSSFALFESGYGIVTPGALLLIIGLMMLAFRNRKPFSHFYEIYIVLEYLTLVLLVRLYKHEPMPAFLSSYLEKTEISDKKLLIVFAFILEFVLGIFLLYLASFLDSSWRRKRDWKIKKLVHDGLLPSEEEEAAEKERIHQEKLNAIEEKKIARQDAKLNKEREKAENKAKKKSEKEEKREQKRYEKLREKKEREREAEEARAKAKAENDADKEREKAEILSRKEAKLAKKEERRAKKENAKRIKAERDEGEESLPPIEFAEPPANPNNPLEFPSFSEMPELKTIEHTDNSPSTSQYDEDNQDDFQMAPVSSNILSTIKDEEDRKSSRPSLESNSHFRSGGMIEATLEAFNNKEKSAPLPPQRPIIGYDDEEEAETEFVQKNDFAPSNLSPDHPRYKLFEALHNNERPQSAKSEATEKASPAVANAAPSDLSPDHPRYKMFQALQNGSRADAQPAPSKTAKTSSVAPSNLSPEHPRYKLFQAIADGAKPESSVSHFPGKAFQPEEESDVKIMKSTYEESSKQTVSEPSTGTIQYGKPEAEKTKPIVKETTARPSLSAFNEEMRAEEKRFEPAPKAEPVRYEMESQPQEEIPAARNDSSSSPDDCNAEQENELELSVGIGGLSSNNMGFYAIKQRSQRNYIAPPVSLLKDYPSANSELDPLTRRKGEIIVEALAQQRVYVELIDIIKGPTVTMYELKLGEGTLISRIKAREAELNYALGGSKIRILAPIPGKQAVGIEVPNASRDTIGFKDMIYALRASEKYKSFRVPMILGKTITGEPVVIDVCKMPHMIIAGTTGSGKSVCINSFINTILYQKGPKEVRLLMVDPKMVELSMYNGIPHLLTPVITDAKRVVKVLNWLVEEMERRYQMISKFGVRNIEGLNEKLTREHIAAERMPYIVLIMDEFADMMSVVGKDIENLVARLTAKARAAGIHLILATQRPSADVITGTIKSNLPARIAFAVSSGTNSRVILDEGGAENLLGKGDMLLLNPSVMGLERIQGAFLSDGEVDEISSFVRKNAGETDYLSEDLFEDDDRDNDQGDSSDVILADSDSDEALYEQAKAICFERKCASASYLQRRMKIGYNRAARLIEMMEEDGIVGEAHGSKPREILRYE